MSDKQATVYTDGSCIGAGSTGAKAGYGVYFGDNHPQNASGPVSGSQTGERAEFKAVDHALSQAAKAGYKQVSVVTDSQTVANACRTGTYSGENQDLLRSIQEKAGNLEVNFHQVKGHSGHAENTAAHNLAQAAAKGLH